MSYKQLCTITEIRTIVGQANQMIANANQRVERAIRTGEIVYDKDELEMTADASKAATARYRGLLSKIERQIQRTLSVSE